MLPRQAVCRQTMRQNKRRTMETNLKSRGMARPSTQLYTLEYGAISFPGRQVQGSMKKQREKPWILMLRLWDGKLMAPILHAFIPMHTDYSVVTIHSHSRALVSHLPLATAITNQCSGYWGHSEHHWMSSSRIVGQPLQLLAKYTGPKRPLSVT